MKNVFLLFLFMSVSFLYGDLILADRGKMNCVIILPVQSGSVEKHAAEELACYLKKISKSKEKPSILSETITGKVNIILSVDKNTACAEEGYILTAGKNTLTIKGRKPLSVLFGVYGLLRNISDIEWVFPGNEGEYFSCSPVLKVTFLEKKIEPSFPRRTLNFHAMNSFSHVKDTWDWMVRNHLSIHTLPVIYQHKKLHEDLKKRGAQWTVNPCFSNLLSGYYWGKNQEKSIDALFRDHKEYFPLIHGKRRKLERQAYQPCTTNKDVIRISGENLYKNFLVPLAGKGEVFIYNDDGTGWCECEVCVKTDSENDRKKSYISSRFWNYLNNLAGYVEKKDKKNSTPIWGMAYQNFQVPPEFAIHPGITGVNLSFNRLCYRHRIDDKKCLLNPFFLSCYEAWSKKGIQVLGREELGVQGDHFLPAEENYIHLLKYYKKKNFSGTFIAVAPPDGTYGTRFKHAKLQWQSMWQILYYHALYLRDIDADYCKYDEKINSFYYGKGWEGGMREFRKLLKETSNNASGCFGWGSSTPLGRCLDEPLVHEKLQKYLASAEKAAAKDPDPRALKHVQFDKKRFAETWEKARKIYLENYRSICSYEKNTDIKIDGIIEEYDWKNADVVTGFKSVKEPGKKEKYQTFLRVCYEKDFLYFALEMEEPHTDKLVTGNWKRDGKIWEDNSIEIFLSHPDMGRGYFQFIFNARQDLFDQKVVPGAGSDPSINISLEAKVKKYKDRWCLEAKIPTAELGHKCFTGQSWKINIMRVRKLKGEKIYSASTLSGGAPHDVNTFQELIFGGRRKLTSGFLEDNPRKTLWKNGSFNRERKPLPAYAKNLNLPNGRLPSDWFFAHRNKEGAIVWEELANGNFFIRLKASYIMQNFALQAKAYQVFCRYRGDGTAVFNILRRDKKTSRHIATKLLKTVKGGNGEEWKECKFTFEDSGDRTKENQNFAIYVQGTMDFDEINIQPLL